ncbi:MAG TPA: PH domain-containing protein [Actinoplanes sp.]|nr:PH domain-containing protein [Actinoplanes sp.]
MTSVEQEWRRLSVRVVHLGLIRLAMSSVSGYLGVTLRDDPVWPLLAGAAFGLLGAVGDLVRWQTTRFRITADVVEMRTGWIARKHRTVGRDRIRSVDSSARLIPRLLGLRTVHIGSGETESSFKLDALDKAGAESVQRELRADAPVARPGPATTGPAAATGAESDISEMSPTESGSLAEPGDLAEPAEESIARLRRSWIWLNALGAEAPFTLIAMVFTLHWALRPFGVDLFAAIRGLSGHLVLLTVLALLAIPVAFAVRAVSFVVDNWRFELVRSGGTLITRHGLFTTKTVQRSDARTRGIAFAEPLLTRRLGVTTTKLLLTGSAAGEGGGDILPRIRLPEARDLAARILPDGARPLEAPLRRHPRGALVRRIGWSLYTPALLAGALLPFPLPGWVWPLPLLLIPVTVPLAVVAYRSLGHTVHGDYLVVRDGALTRKTVALQNRAVIGWSLEQSLWQRWAGRMTVGVATAAGSRHYVSPDMGADQALALIAEATPHLADAIIDREVSAC